VSLTSTERKRLWRQRHPEKRRAAERARSRLRCRVLGGSYWKYEQGMKRFNSRMRQLGIGYIRQLETLDQEITALRKAAP